MSTGGLNRRGFLKRAGLVGSAAYVLAIAMVCGYAVHCQAQDVQEGDPATRAKAIEAELQALERGEGAPPAYQEYRQLREELRNRREAFDEELRPQRDHLQELSQDKDFQTWQSKIVGAVVKLRRLRDQIQENLQQRGRELQERRQVELAQVAAADTPNARALGFTVLDYPAVDGSTSAQPLGMIVACKMLGCRHQWAGEEPYSGRWYIGEPPEDLSKYADFLLSAKMSSEWVRDVVPSNLTLVSFRPIAVPADPERREDVRRSVIVNHMLTNHAGTHGAYENVITGRSDIGLVARAPSGDELALAAKEGVELDVIPIAFDAFVFIKNYENPVEGLSTEQIKEIYSGNVTKWSDAGGPDEAITAYRRDKNSGSQELMESLVMKDTSFAKLDDRRTQYMVHSGMGGPYIALSTDKWGLGYSVYYYEHFMAASPNTVVLAVDGVVPSYQTIQSGEYPYVTNVYAVTRKGATTESRTLELRDWLLSSEGQAVIRESGYVPVRNMSPG